VGRITRGRLAPNTQVAVIDRDGASRAGRVLQVMGYLGLERVETQRAEAGDIVCVTGIDGAEHLRHAVRPAGAGSAAALTVDEPTVSMTFQVNDSPFAGKEGKYVTSRNIAERLERELIHNVALRVEPGDSPDKFKVSGRGELHLSVLIETMRREGFELGVSRPEVIRREIDGVMQEPFEELVIDCEDAAPGLGDGRAGAAPRRAQEHGAGRQGAGAPGVHDPCPGPDRLPLPVPHADLGSGTMTHVFDHYGPVKEAEIRHRSNGVLVSMVNGKTLAYALYNLQDRGRLFVDPNIEVYEGQIVGLHSRGNDLPVNPTKAKQLTNIRAAGTDEALVLTPPVKHTWSRPWSSSMTTSWWRSPPRASACARNCSRSTSASAPRGPRRRTDAGAPAARARGRRAY
jgi:GTP-binding protein